MPTLTAHVSEDFVRQIDLISRHLDRSRAWVIKEALKEYLERRAQEGQRWAETLEAIEAADQGEVVPAEDVLAWLDTWGAEGERAKDTD